MSKEDLIQKAHEEEEALKQDSEEDREEDEDEEEEEAPSDDSAPDEVPEEVRRQRWFSDPLFSDLSREKKEELPLSVRLQAYSTPIPQNSYVDDEEDAALLEDGPKVDGSAIADGEYVPPLFEVPKSDKERRREKRLKRLEKEKRKKERENKNELQVVENDFPQAVNHLTEEQLAHQALIKAGIGAATDDGIGELEVVKKDKEPKIGSEEHLEALSLGFLLSKHSTANDLIDSSFNRYVFNDPEDLPQWFVDDEKKYNRPQLPMTKEVIERLRKQFNTEDRTIKKEREALARKRRRVERMRQQQKAKIDSINNDEDLPDLAKLKAIQKLMKGKDMKHPGKTYVVAKKGDRRRGGKNVKLVDKRLKVGVSLESEG